MNLNIKKLKYILPVAVVALAVGMTSCEDEKETVTGFQLDKESIELPDNGGQTEIQIRTNERWTASSDADWYMVSPANGEGSAICVVKADSSYMYTQREGMVTFRTATGEYKVKVHQGGYDRTIKFESLQDDTVHVPSYKPLDKSYVDIEVTSNVSYKVTIPEEKRSWLYIKEDNGEKYEEEFTSETTIPRKRKVRIHFKTYIESDADRRGDVIFKEMGREDGIESKVGIIQTKAPRIIPSREGDSLALITVARMLNAGITWDTSRPITHWPNVTTKPITYIYHDGDVEEERTEERVVGVTYSMIETKDGLPDQIKYLDQLETLIVMSNSNSQIRDIELGTSITELKKLKSLSLFAYGICKLPEEMGAKMPALEELNLAANNFRDIDKDVVKPLSGLGERLKYLQLNACRKVDAVTSLENIENGIDPSTNRAIGLTGNLPASLFTTFPNLEYLNLSFNYLYGSLPELNADAFKDGKIMPKLRYLSVNLNRFTGDLPKWMIEHEFRGCWSSDILIFNQEGKDNNGKVAGFTNSSIAQFREGMECPEETEEETTQILGLPKLSIEQRTDAANFASKYAWEKYGKLCPVFGSWRYYNRNNVY